MSNYIFLCIQKFKAILGNFWLNIRYQATTSFALVGFYLMLKMLIGVGVISLVVFAAASLAVYQTEGSEGIDKLRKTGYYVVAIVTMFTCYIYSFGETREMAVETTSILFKGVVVVKLITKFLGFPTRNEVCAESWVSEILRLVLGPVLDLVTIVLMVKIYELSLKPLLGQSPEISGLVGVLVLEFCQRKNQHKEIYTTFWWPASRAFIIFLCVYQWGLRNMGIHLFTQ